MKKVSLIDEFIYKSIGEALLMQDKFLINDSENVFFFRIISYSNGDFKLKVYQEQI